ncbi:hypothetical protein KC669_00710 [Candidatus Dojkabacteria bacterium]|uniref:Uncharacterized protein n=1 Tax=Candidatus Dojkabacteria bacterium TaxID=2099670 RepID=A0A955RLN1_9BACT|nr:hypothetical protein [Candidatus Dojkabacteria bacterium]
MEDIVELGEIINTDIEVEIISNNETMPILSMESSDCSDNADLKGDRTRDYSCNPKNDEDSKDAPNFSNQNVEF